MWTANAMQWTARPGSETRANPPCTTCWCPHLLTTREHVVPTASSAFHSGVDLGRSGIAVPLVESRHRCWDPQRSWVAHGRFSGTGLGSRPRRNSVLASASSQRTDVGVRGVRESRRGQDGPRAAVAKFSVVKAVGTRLEAMNARCPRSWIRRTSRTVSMDSVAPA